MNKMCDQSPNTQPVNPIWAVSARIVEERSYGPGGEETKRGTRKFRARQKVYLQDVFWGSGGADVTVIGRHHGKHRFISNVMPTRHLTNFRAELVYSPTIIERIQYGYTPKEKRRTLTQSDIDRHELPLDGSQDSKQKAEKMALWLGTMSRQERNNDEHHNP